MQLNNKDKIILESLFQDCRISLKELSRRTHLTHPAILYRIKKYENEGLIGRYDALLDMNKLEIPTWIIFVSVPKRKVKDFEEYCVKNKVLMTVLKHIHKFNYSMTAPLSVKEYDKLINYLDKNGFEYKANKIKKHIAFDYRIIDDVDIKKKNVSLSEDKLNLDSKDIKLIETLYHGGGRYSALELARRTRLSADLVVYRFRKLNKAKYFVRYLTHPDFKKFNIRYVIIKFKINNLKVKEVSKVFEKTEKTILLFESEKNNYLATLIIRDLKTLEKTLEIIHDGLGDYLIKLDIFPCKDHLFLNRLDLKRVFEVEG
jgi:Lrp/AsnC family leucine-responsive transcriptional regulator